MTKAELLAELATQFDSVASPVKQQGAVKADGGQVYSVMVRQNSGDTAGYRNVRFLVYNEGTGGEVAYYDQRKPVDDVVSRSTFKEWIKEQISSNPDNYKGLIIHYLNEFTEEAVFSKLEGTAVLERSYFWARRGQGISDITNFDPTIYSKNYRVWPE